MSNVIRCGSFPALCACLLLASGCTGGLNGDPAAESLPVASGAAAGHNVLLITVDTLRADHVGAYGYRRAQTARIDSLAQSGVLFEQATTTAPITMPAHATIHTGLLPPNHGVRHNGIYRLGEEHETLAETLHRAGYATGAFVGAYVLDSRYGLGQGFDLYDDAVNPGNLPAGASQYNERSAARVSDAALAWLETQIDDESKPFFAWLHYFDPHFPYAAPEPFATRLDGFPYDAEIAYTDEQIGRIIDLLVRRRVIDRTLIVFTADHGEGLGEHDELTHADLIYDSTMRVPLIVSSRTLFPRGIRLSDGLVGSVDIAPTLLGLLGLESPEGVSFDGVDVLGQSIDPQRAMYVETLSPLLDYGWSALHGLRRVDDKFIEAPAPEYYDLEGDPAELVNLYAEGGEGRELQRQLARRMDDWPDDLEAVGLKQAIDDEQRARLAALGYASLGASGPELGVKNPREMMGLRRRISRAGWLSQRDRHDEAIGVIDAVLVEDPHDAKALYEASSVYERAGRVDVAEEKLLRALALGPRADGWVNLARLALGRGALERYEAALAEAERLDPYNGGVPLGRGHGLAMQGRFDEARRQFVRAIEIDPVKTGPEARAQIERLDAMRRGTN